MQYKKVQKSSWNEPYSSYFYTDFHGVDVQEGEGQTCGRGVSTVLGAPASAAAAGWTTQQNQLDRVVVRDDNSASESTFHGRLAARNSISGAQRTD